MNTPTGLQDRVIIVTGGTGRLGQAVTQLLLQRGAQVVVTYTKDAEFERLEKALSTQEREHLSAHQVDVSDEKQVAGFVGDVMEKFKRIDGLANLVGGWDSTPVVELTLEAWNKQLDMNLKSAFLMSRAVLPHMIAAKYGRIMGVGAQSAIQAAKNQTHYNVSKVGVMWLMETMSNEVKQHGVTANAILPSAIKTKAENEKDPGGAWAMPEEIAPMIAYLMSPESRATSGAKIPVYGKA